MSDLELADDLRSAIGDFVRRVRLVDRMPANQAAVLGHLDRSGPLSIADLARREQVKHQSMTRTVHLLEEQGLVTLSAHPQDRRRQLATLEPAGAQALSAEREHRASSIARSIHESLTPAERDVVRQIPAILRKLQP